MDEKLVEALVEIEALLWVEFEEKTSPETTARLMGTIQRLDKADIPFNRRTNSRSIKDIVFEKFMNGELDG